MSEITPVLLDRSQPYQQANVVLTQVIIDALEQAKKRSGHERNLLAHGYVWAWHDGYRYHYLKDEEFHERFITIENHLHAIRADERRLVLEANGIAYCRVCGCTDAEACEGGCWWVEEDFCSACLGVESEEKP